MKVNESELVDEIEGCYARIKALKALLEQALKAWASYATNSRERADIAKIRAEAELEKR
jgi:hypothetical protein